jgi:hypothetical protein
MADPAAPATPAAPVSLLDQFGNGVGAIGNALMSLLGPVVSAGQVTSGQDPGAVPAFLAFANRMAQAGAPTLAPPTPLITAFPQAMAAGYGAARQADVLPLLTQQAGLETAREQVGLQASQFELDRAKALFNLGFAQSPLYTGVGATPPPGAPGGATPGSAAGPGGAGGPGTQPPSGPQPVTNLQPATTEQLAALPDIMRLPDNIRPLAIQSFNQVGMSTDEAAQYARQIAVESKGQQTDPQTGKVLTSAKGAQGVAQVLPATFTDMQAKYGIPGSITDPQANLLAGAHYFHEGVVSDGLRNGVIRYSAGPDGLKNYYATGNMPAETADYLAKSYAPPAPGTGAPGAPTGPLPTNYEPMVPDPVSGQMVPQGILAAARGAYQAAVPNGFTAAQTAYQGEISKWQQQRAAAGTVLPSGVPGIGIDSRTGAHVEQPLGAATSRPLTPAEVDKYIPGHLPGAQYSGNFYAGGELANQLKDPPVLIPTGATTVRALTGPELDQYVPNHTETQDYQGKFYISGPQTGQLAEPATLLAPRSANQAFQNAFDIQSKLQSQPAMENWQNSQNRYSLMMDGLNAHTRVGDEAAVLSLAKIFDPTAVVRDNRIEMAQGYGGLPQRLTEMYGAALGATGIPDAVRQEMGQIGNDEMRRRDSAALYQIQQARDFAHANGVDENRIMPSFVTEASGPDEVGTYGNLPGVTYQPAFQWNPETRNFERQPVKRTPPAQPARAPQIAGPLPPNAPGAPQPPGGAGGAPGGGAAVQATPPPGAAQPPAKPAQATTNRLTPLALNLMSPTGLARLQQDMQAHGENYTDADRDAFIARRKALAP